MSPHLSPALCARCPEIFRRLDVIEAQPDTSKLLEELAGFHRSSAEARDAAQDAKRVAAQLFDEVGRLRTEMDRLAEWRDDSKIQEIGELRRSLEMKVERDAYAKLLDAQRDSRTDRRRFWFALVLAFAGAVATGFVGRSTAHLGCGSSVVR
jgi:hypothetical protein